MPSPDASARTNVSSAALAELIDVAKAGTPWALGGTPDLFWPECSEHARRCDDPWDCHERRVTAAVAAVTAASSLTSDGG